MIPLLMVAAAFAAQDVTLTAGDGTRLHARTTTAKDAEKGVILVHMVGRQASDWDYLANRLNERGLTVVAPDLRGHGTSAKAGEDLSEDDFLAMTQDVAASVAWLKKQGIQDISCVGASIGANLCLNVAAEEPGISNLVLLSPGLKYKGVTTPAAMDSYGERPVLLVAAEDDSYSFKSSQILDGRAKGQKHFELLEGNGHGTKLLNREPTLEGIVTSWLLGTYQLANGEVVRPRPASSTDAGQVETTGDKLGVHQ